jgi:ribosomal protein S18 acetylase RimI-like enzyme
MTSERVVLIATVDTVLIAEPTVDSRVLTDGDLRDVAQLLVEAVAGSPGDEFTLEHAEAKIAGLSTGDTGEPRRDAWLGIWKGPGIPVSAILCTTWRGMPFIAHIATSQAARERGYATSLVRDAATVFEKTGATHIGVSLDRESPAMHLFRELGFVEMFSTVDA